MRLKIRPSDDSFYEFFTRAAANLVQGTELLSELAIPGADVQSVSERLGEVEHDSDTITHEAYNKINSTFITPFDREDIYRLASNLDDVMDHLEAAGNLVYLYGLTQLPALPREMHELVAVLDRQARLTSDAMPRLKSMKDLKEYWVECNRLENDGDRAYRMLVVRLFSGEYDTLTVLKMKEVADELEAACDAFEHVANTVEQIAVKES
jgi:predicted phosphate transport protein (TIGR00153 family)